MSDHEGALVLVGTPIGNLGDLSPRAIDALRDADVIAAEDTRRTRALLSHAGVPAGRRLRAVHGHNERRLAAAIVEEVRAGARVVYATDAGMPGISDPGERLVRACVDAGLAVEIVPGPSALLTGLVVSGLPTQRFVFEGFLPRKGKLRAERLAVIAAEPRTVVFYESPIRIAGTLADLAAVCGPDREVAVARELTKRFEEVWRGRLGNAAADPAVVGTRGEFVVVVAPAPEATEAVGDEGLEAAVDAALDTGLSARDAAARVAADLAVPKRRAYDAATRRSRARARS
ncbi:MAG: 16S rRNA (cytidine(1402)-2'-O)-methyltransferase [Acidimicrobiia bacterium]